MALYRTTYKRVLHTSNPPGQLMLVEDVVEAADVSVQDGALVFYGERHDAAGEVIMPEIIRILAPGSWITCEGATPGESELAL